MLHENLLITLLLLFAVSMMIMLGQKLKISYPIFLVLAGLLITFIPGVPRFKISADWVFMVILPPLLYQAAWNTPWNNFWKWKRSIVMLAFGLVLFTSCIVAYFSNAFIPGFTMPLGLLLGAIISPPDAIAANSVLQDMKVPRQTVTILEGESLLNDAASLIVFRFALEAVLTGRFIKEEAAVAFIVVGFMGIVTGLAFAALFYIIHRYLPTTPSMDATLELIAPYFMYLVAEHYGYSGVMAVVSGGLFMSSRSVKLHNYAVSRMHSAAMGSVIVFILNGLVFILIGLQLPLVVAGLHGYSIAQALKYAVVISLLTIIVRMLWLFFTSFVPGWLSSKIRTKAIKQSWQSVFVISWAGMRGVVSLASALSVPLILNDGQFFPQRNLILFITFTVILVTLVFQGITLPFLVRFLKFEEEKPVIPNAIQEADINKRLLDVALKELNENYTFDVAENEMLQRFKSELERDLLLHSQVLASSMHNIGKVDRFGHVTNNILRNLRRELSRMRKENNFDEEVLKKREKQMDLDEARIYHHIH
ncbi:Na+/H+ antiporter [Dyadobacter frigoris]|uniref:Na+/H+ antiporter n=1 Tax=Dyadobacter frigoris TaxID=2576211 RepID=A0A4V6BIS3_9BACT|nr:Na+/H+ antiporter [Dyadobacter frigoris]TKT89413.1 Na+/H+ antiporter [Dyadobacter frigoris]